MALPLNSLSGFLQIGPHYFPERTNGAQIIQRGPHGQRLAADPVFLREHDQPRGSGFRFWHEQLNVPANVEWNPQQVVTGVMGMGGLGSLGSSTGWRYMSLIQALANQNNVSMADVCALQNVNGMVFGGMAERAYPSKSDVRSSLEEIRILVAGVKGESPSADTANAMICLGRERVQQLGGDGAILSDLGKLQNMLIIRRNKIREDGKPMIAPGAVDSSGARREITQEEYCRRNPSACFPEDGNWFKQNWWKVALGVGALVAVSGAAKGFGRGLASR